MSATGSTKRIRPVAYALLLATYGRRRRVSPSTHTGGTEPFARDTVDSNGLFSLKRGFLSLHFHSRLIPVLSGRTSLRPTPIQLLRIRPVAYAYALFLATYNRRACRRRVSPTHTGEMHSRLGKRWMVGGADDETIESNETVFLRYTTSTLAPNAARWECIVVRELVLPTESSGPFTKHCRRRTEPGQAAIRVVRVTIFNKKDAGVPYRRLARPDVTKRHPRICRVQSNENV